MAVGTRMQQRRATAAEWATSGYILAPGEFGVTTDTGIIKIGNGVDGWSVLEPAFDSHYLPILGTATNSDLLGGISADGFRKVIDSPTYSEMNQADTNAIATSIASGAIKTALDANSVEDRKLAVSRYVSSNFFVQATDAGDMIVAENTNYEPDFECVIETNATTPIPTGSVVTIASTNKGAVRISGTVGVTIVGNGMVYGGGSISRLIKTATNTWLVAPVYQSPGPSLRRLINNSSYSIPAATDIYAALAGSDTTAPSYSKNFDSLGVDQQWSSAANDRIFCRREGHYNVVGKFSLASIVAGKRMFVDFEINDVNQWLGGGSATGTSTAGVIQTAQIALSVGDYLRLLIRHDDTVARNISHNVMGASYVQWQWLRPL